MRRMRKRKVGDSEKAFLGLLLIRYGCCVGASALPLSGLWASRDVSLCCFLCCRLCFAIIVAERHR